MSVCVCARVCGLPVLRVHLSSCVSSVGSVARLQLSAALRSHMAASLTIQRSKRSWGIIVWCHESHAPATIALHLVLIFVQLVLLIWESWAEKKNKKQYCLALAEKCTKIIIFLYSHFLEIFEKDLSTRTTQLCMGKLLIEVLSALVGFFFLAVWPAGLSSSLSRRVGVFYCSAAQSLPQQNTCVKEVTCPSHAAICRR